MKTISSINGKTKEEFIRNLLFSVVEDIKSYHIREQQKEDTGPIIPYLVYKFELKKEQYKSN